MQRASLLCRRGDPELLKIAAVGKLLQISLRRVASEGEAYEYLA